MSCPEDWEFHVSHLATISKDGIDAIYSALDELEEAGLLMRSQINEKGSFGPMEYIIYPVPIDNLKKSLPHRDFQDTEKSHAENPPLQKKDILKKKEKEKEAATPPSLPRRKVPEEKKEVAPRVFVTPSQEEDLLKRFDHSVEKIKSCYDKLSMWKVSKEMQGGQDYRMIMNWVQKAVEEDEKKLRVSPEGRKESDEELAKKIQQAYPDHRDMSFGYNYIEFTFGYNNTLLRFGDHGFREQAENALRKMGLRMP